MEPINATISQRTTDNTIAELRTLRTRYHIKECQVSVRRFSLEEMSRMTVNPSWVLLRCARCCDVVENGPKCTNCNKCYHYDCAIAEDNCCNKRIVFATDLSGKCLKCRKPVQFGPQCYLCGSKYHKNCISLLYRCCHRVVNTQVNTRRGNCGSCSEPVTNGPVCPFCSSSYHLKCVKGEFRCCGHLIGTEYDKEYKCSKCRRKVRLGSPLCLFCGKPIHFSCVERLKNVCCGQKRGASLEVYFIPYFQNPKNDKRSPRVNSETPGFRKRSQSMPVLEKETYITMKRCRRITTPPTLEPVQQKNYTSKTKRLNTNSKSTQRAKHQRNPVAPEPAPASPSSPTTSDESLPPVLTPVGKVESLHQETSISSEGVRIVSVKGEQRNGDGTEWDEPPRLEPQEPLDQHAAPSAQVLETACGSTDSPANTDSGPSESSTIAGPDPLESLFYFLYDSVKKLPKELQTPLRFQLFKIVNDAEMQHLQE